MPLASHRSTTTFWCARLPLLALALLAGARSAEAGRLARYGGTVRVQCAGLEAQALDPLQLHGDDGALLAACLYEGLTRWGAERVEPALATRWFQSDDAKRWLFHLRPGVRFHDGSPCDGDAVITSLHELAHPQRSTHAWMLRALAGWDEYARGESPLIEGMYVVSATEIELHFLEPVVDLPARLALPAAGIARRGGVNPSGTGPFRVGAAGADSVQLLANEAHRDGPPFLSSLVFVAGGTRTTEPSRALHRQDPGRQVRPGFTPVRVPARRLAFAILHPSSDVFATAAARQQVATAFDAPVFVRAALGGDGEPAFGLQPDAAVVPATPTDDSLSTPPLRAGAPVRILVSDGEPTLVSLAERLHLHLIDLGLVSKLETIAASQLRAATQKGDWDIVVLGWTPLQGHREDIQEATRVLSLLSATILPAFAATLPPPWRDLMDGLTPATEAGLCLSGTLLPLVFFHDVWQAPDGADNLLPSPAAVSLGLQNVHLRSVGP